MLYTKINVGAALFAGLLAVNLFFVVSEETGNPGEEPAVTEERIYELRTYTTHPGKLEDLHERFANHTVRLFARHGMVNVGYWIPVDQENTLIYILSHNSRQAAEQSWQAFRDDPEWQQAYEASHADGEIVSNIESVFMNAAPYSQLR